MKVPAPYLLAGGLVAAVALYVVTRPSTAARSFGEQAGAAAVDLVSGVLTGAVDGLNAAVNAGVSSATGEQGNTLGGWLNDLLTGKVDGSVPKTPEEARRVLAEQAAAEDRWRVPGWWPTIGQ